MIGYGILFALSLVMAPGDEQAKGAGGRMKIELDALSGRENPTWALSDEQAKEFATTFASLKAGDPAKPLKEGLGYRGFKVTGVREYDELTVWSGIVHTVRGGKTIRWEDKDRSLERLLLKSSKVHIEEPIYKYVEGAVEKE